MATERQQKRKELREKRLQAESKSKGADQRQNLVKALAAIGFVAAIGVVVAVVLIVTGSSDEPETAKSSTDIEKLFDGIEQNGTVLGDPNAKVTVVEFADLECGSCKAFADEGLPKLIKEEIRPGRAKLDISFLQTASQDFEAAKAALAASNQGRFWQFVEYFYVNQGTPGTGYATDDFLTDIAEKAGVPDIDQWNADRDLPKWDEVLLEDDDRAVAAGVSGTPTFAIESQDGSLELIPKEPLDSIEEIKKAIARAQ